MSGGGEGVDVSCGAGAYAADWSVEDGDEAGVAEPVHDAPPYPRDGLGREVGFGEELVELSAGKEPGSLQVGEWGGVARGEVGGELP